MAAGWKGLDGRGPGLAAIGIQADFHSAQASMLLWMVKNWKVRINSKDQEELGCSELYKQ